ncbi:MAG: hypothetical protein ACT4QE_09065 [Anaerolineales bacterium]
MIKAWTEVLLGNRYPFDLRRFADTAIYPGWFNSYSSEGDRDATIAFESYFRENAGIAIEPWIEVVYWKLYSQPYTRGDKACLQLAQHCRDKLITPEGLLEVCNKYVGDSSRKNFQEIRQLLGLKSSAIAVAATFPAFLRPDQFPMIDTRVAKWVAKSMYDQNGVDSKRPLLSRPKFADSKQSTLGMNDFDFMQDWIRWCRYNSQQLTKLTNVEWRARDVEMAVFTAWGEITRSILK